ncbi:MAG: radical SAM protein [Endomicrobiia bacterium]
MKNFHIQWHITEICNLNCLHCYKEPYRKELSLLQLKTVLNNLVDFLKERNLTLNLTITGGEPFLKPQLYELLSYIDGIPLIKKINFITNGTVIPEKKLQNLSKLGMLYLSIESLNSSVNDKIRGKGILSKVLHNLEYFVKNYRVGIMTTLMRSNFSDLKKNLSFFVENLFKMGIREIIFERFIPAGKSKNLKTEMLSQQEVFDFYAEISKYLKVSIEELKKYPAIKLVNNFLNHYDITKISIYGAYCIFAKNGFAILCDGTVYPCRRYTVEAGNFLTHKNIISFKNLIKSSKKSLSTVSDSIYFNCYAANLI